MTDPPATGEVDIRTGALQPAFLPIASLLKGVLMRSAGVDHRHVEILADVSSELPPIVVHRQTMAVVDGVHRIAAARLRGESEILAVFVEGDIMDAFLMALNLNSRHGLPLTRKDRRAAVDRILAVSPHWSDRRVAAAAGVSPKTVATVRRSSTEESRHSNTRIGLDGRERPLDVADARRRAHRLLSEQPSSTVRQVAAATGVSLATVQDVRRRMAMETTTLEPEEPRAELDPRTQDERFSNRLRSLRADPSLRDTIAGRDLLQMLSAQIRVLEGRDDLAQAVPTHRRENIMDLARRCSDAWLRFAADLENASEQW
jgi:ParB-like chromosome segregation protein Spo0J